VVHNPWQIIQCDHVITKNSLTKRSEYFSHSTQQILSRTRLQVSTRND